jgi:hypothetical protein
MNYLPCILTAVEHYAAYMRADRDGRPYADITDAQGEGQGKEEQVRTARKKRA